MINILKQQWWVVLIAIAIACGYFFIPSWWWISMAILAYVLYLLFWVIQFAGVSQMEQNQVMFERLSYEIDSRQVLLKINAKQGMPVKWEMIKRAEIKKDAFVDLVIEISDNGIGMSSEKLNEIINSNNSKGISAVKNLMNILDGKLEIESKENEYTKVTLTFKQKIITDNKVRLKLEKNKTTESFELDGKKILIVDDNKLNLKVTNRLLEPYKVDTTLVESGIEAIELIKDNNIYDLILLDQMMPSMDGTTTLTKLKEIKNFNTPVVVLTADAIKGRKEIYLKEGFDDYISKPIDKKELNRVLEKFLKSGGNGNE